MTDYTRAMIAAIVENIITLGFFTAIVILAPGAWKWAAIACLLNINSVNFQKNK